MEEKKCKVIAREGLHAHGCKEKAVNHFCWRITTYYSRRCFHKSNHATPERRHRRVTFLTFWNVFALLQVFHIKKPSFIINYRKFLVLKYAKINNRISRVHLKLCFKNYFDFSWRVLSWYELGSEECTCWGLSEPHWSHIAPIDKKYAYSGRSPRTDFKVWTTAN